MGKRFIQESITVEWDEQPVFSKDPHAPDRFTWRDDTYAVVEVRSEWRNYERRGRMSRNMRPSNLRKASKRGSWGVGEYYFEVRVAEEDRVFQIYYDRQPKDSDHPEGQWFMYTEVVAE